MDSQSISDESRVRLFKRGYRALVGPGISATCSYTISVIMKGSDTGASSCLLWSVSKDKAEEVVANG